MSTIVRLGNPNPQMQQKILDENGAETGQTRSYPAPHLTVSTTEVTLREDYDDEAECELALSTGNDQILNLIAQSLEPEHKKYAVGVLELFSLMGTHSGGEKPTWVDCPDDPDFEAAIASFFGCDRGESIALLTSVGRDGLHKQHMDTAAQPAAFNYMCVSANATAASAASTTCPGEITTVGGGLLRAQATFAHTTGTNTSTLTKTFTANGSDTLPVTLAKIGILNAASVGILGYETLLNATSTLTISGDNTAITETVTGG